jgi:hypothetical protein
MAPAATPGGSVAKKAKKAATKKTAKKAAPKKKGKTGFC